MHFEKLPRFRIVGVEESLRILFAKLLFKACRQEAAMASSYDNLCAGLKSGI